MSSSVDLNGNIFAPVVDGKIEQTASSKEENVSKATNSSALDKDAFLQLLVAQMKYQDPLEPTSNTEYISQYATFSELEQMQNMSSTMELSRAASLVGKTVTVSMKDDDGETISDTGIVDFISYENSKALVWVNGTSYPLDGVTEVTDPQYVEAYAKASTLVAAIRKLPTMADLTVESREAVESIQKTYDEMNDYQKSFVASDYVDIIKDYSTKMDELVKLEELNADKNNSDKGKTDTE